MPNFITTIELVDAAGRSARKTYEHNETDFATAQVAAAALADDLQAITELEVLAHTTSERTVYGSGVLTSGANKDEGAVFSLRKADNYKASHRVPGPIQAMRNTGNDRLDTDNADVVEYFQNFITGNFTISDGESATALISGVLEK
jgi:hypothetical protein